MVGLVPKGIVQSLCQVTRRALDPLPHLPAALHSLNSCVLSAAGPEECLNKQMWERGAE